MARQRLFLIATAALMFISTSAFTQGTQGTESFSGEIMDDLCAKDGTHSKMREEMKSMGSDPITCTKKCVQLGAKYVLVDHQKNVVYALGDQDKAEPFAGQWVHITGSLDKKKIKIASIEHMEPEGQKR